MGHTAAATGRSITAMSILPIGIIASVRAMQGAPITVNTTIRTLPSMPAGSRRGHVALAGRTIALQQREPPLAACSN